LKDFTDLKNEEFLRNAKNDAEKSGRKAIKASRLTFSGNGN